MKPKTLALLCVALGCGLVAMIGVQQAMKPAVANVEMIQVLEALDNIDPGVPLSVDNVAFKEIPKEAAQEDCVTTLEEYEKRSLTVAVVKGEYILKGKLSAPGVSGKSIQIPIGKIVFTINVDETQTASNMMKAGDIVDVGVTYDARTPSGMQTKTMTLLECVPVFAIGDLTKNDMMRQSADTSIKARQVSLVVSGDEATALQLAERKGTLRLLWRNPQDLTRHNTKSITDNLLTELRGIERNSPPVTGSEAKPQERPPVAVVQAPQQPPKDVRQFLAEPGPAVATPVAVEPEPKATPEKPMWEIKVYVGNDVQSYPFELAEPASSKANDTNAKAAAGLIEKFGWKLPWTANGASNDAVAAPAQAL